MEEQTQSQPVSTPPSTTPLVPVIQNNKFLIVIAILVFLLMTGGLAYLGYQNYQLRQQLRQQNLTDSSGQKIIEEKDVPNFSESSIKPKAKFDIATWKAFDDSEVGLKFRYPQEWGSPKRTLDSCTQSCSADETTPAWFYKIEFQNSQFSVGGAGENWLPQRGTNILYDFKGFIKRTQKDLCQIPWFLSCDIENNKIRYTSSLACGGEPGSGFNYERVMLIDVLNSKKLRGLAFGGNFIPKDSRTADLISCEEGTKKLVDQALIDRKLDASTMENFDLYNAIFDTVEIY